MGPKGRSMLYIMGLDTSRCTEYCGLQIKLQLGPLTHKKFQGCPFDLETSTDDEGEADPKAYRVSIRALSICFQTVAPTVNKLILPLLLCSTLCLSQLLTSARIEFMEDICHLLALFEKRMFVISIGCRRWHMRNLVWLLRFGHQDDEALNGLLHADLFHSIQATLWRWGQEGTAWLVFRAHSSPQAISGPWCRDWWEGSCQREVHTGFCFQARLSSCHHPKIRLGRSRTILPNLEAMLSCCLSSVFLHKLHKVFQGTTWVGSVMERPHTIFKNVRHIKGQILFCSGYHTGWS